MDKIKRGSQTTEHEEIALIFQDVQKSTLLTSPLRGRPLDAASTYNCTSPTACTGLNTRNAKMKVKNN